MNTRTSFLICFFLGCCLPAKVLAQQKGEQKKLIEFGWDYPTVSYLGEHINSMQKTPFNGVVFSFDFDIYNSFDTSQYNDIQFQYDDLSRIDWQNFTDNFLFVRGAGHSGPHWLDDKAWQKIVGNLQKVSKAVSVSKAKGIGFDPEYYYSDSTLNSWVYRASWYNNLSYEEVGEYVRRRGKQFIQALQTYKPDVKILCFWLLGLVDMQAKALPIAKTGMALYPFFVEGMLEGKSKTSEIIDGNESSYWYQKPGDFITAGESLRENGSKLIDKSLQSEFKKISLAQSVFFDGLYARHARFEKGFTKETKRRWLISNLYNAYKTTDKYVWFYSERINWWKGDVDSGVAKFVTEVKNKINAEKNKSDQISGNSVVADFTKKQPIYYNGFHYQYSKSKNTLRIDLLNRDINSLQLYNNSRLIYEYSSIPVNSTIALYKIYNKKGNLILMSKDKMGIVSVAYIN